MSVCVVHARPIATSVWCGPECERLTAIHEEKEDKQ